MPILTVSLARWEGVPVPLFNLLVSPVNRETALIWARFAFPQKDLSGLEQSDRMKGLCWYRILTSIFPRS